MHKPYPAQSPLSLLRRAGLAALPLALIAAQSTHAADFVWDDGGANANWSTAGNWTADSGFPSAADDTASIDAGGAFTVSYGGANQNNAFNNSITSLTLGSDDRLNWQQGSNNKSLSLSASLANAGEILLINPSGNNFAFTLSLTGTGLDNTGGINLLNRVGTAGTTNRDIVLNLAAGNTNAGAINIGNSSLASTEGTSHDATLNITGSGTFTNTGAINVAKTDANNAGTTATIQAASATYRQTAGVTRVGTGASLTAHTVAIDAGMFEGNGTVSGTTGGVAIGDGLGVADAIFRINQVVLDTPPGPLTSLPAFTASTDIASLTVTGDLVFNSDAVFEFDIDIASAGAVAADLLVVTGDLALNGAELALNNLGADIALDLGTYFTVVNHTGSVSGSFAFGGDILADGGMFTVGENTFQISYAGDGTTGALTGGTDIILTTVAAIPETSTFALVAGLGALAAVATRRRRLP